MSTRKHPALASLLLLCALLPLRADSGPGLRIGDYAVRAQDPGEETDNQEGTAKKNDTVPDSLLHFMGGLSAGFFSSSWVTARGVDSKALETGAALTGAVLAGALKESLDALGAGRVEFRDFLWTLAGGAAAAGVVELLRESGTSPPDRSILLAFMGIEFSLSLALPAAERISGIPGNRRPTGR